MMTAPIPNFVIVFTTPDAARVEFARPKRLNKATRNQCGVGGWGGAESGKWGATTGGLADKSDPHLLYRYTLSGVTG